MARKLAWSGWERHPRMRMRPYAGRAALWAIFGFLFIARSVRMLVRWNYLPPGY